MKFQNILMDEDVLNEVVLDSNMASSLQVVLWENNRIKGIESLITPTRGTHSEETVYISRDLVHIDLLQNMLMIKSCFVNTGMNDIMDYCADYEVSNRNLQKIFTKK